MVREYGTKCMNIHVHFISNMDDEGWELCVIKQNFCLYYM